MWDRLCLGVIVRLAFGAIVRQKKHLTGMTLSPNKRIALVALAIFALDQLTKFIVVKQLRIGEEKVILDGFFKFVHWGNTGAAWSLFRGYNEWLAIIALLALLVLFLSRHHFDAHTLWGQIALGLVFGGIVGNLTDRMRFDHVIDFIYFFVYRRGTGQELGFPAFNIADSAICTGVGLMFLLSWRNEQEKAARVPPPAHSSTPELTGPEQKQANLD